MTTDFKALWRAKADGKEIECLGRVEAIGVPNRWGQITTVAVMAQFFEGDDSAYAFRVKPETIMVNGHEVPAPLTEQLPPGVVHWAVCINGEEVAVSLDNSHTHFHLWLQRGLLHSTKGAAEIHAAALLQWPKNTK